MSRLNFRLEKVASGSKARATTFRTLHNEVQTPLFMPVGTRATVRAQTLETLEGSNAQILLANTYHLLLRPGPEVFRKAGGIHRFMHWNKSVLTDSGGFQIFSLSHARKMNERGAEFKSYIDNSKILLTPEASIEMQKAIGSDIMMVLDQCVPSNSDRALCEEAMGLTHRWALRSFEARGDSPQSLFGIVQGACFPDLRKQSADFLTQIPFDGFALGGLAVGESKAEREDTTELTAELLPQDRPRYLMGVGMPIDLLEAVHRGVDLFDCIIPTALAQQGEAFTSKGHISLRRGVYRFSEEPLDPQCSCPTCTRYSRSYLHFLVKTQEVLGWHLIGCHNLYFYSGLMRQMREHILADTFEPFYREMRTCLAEEDQDHPVRRPRMRPKRNKSPILELGNYEVFTSPHGFSSIRQKSSGEIMHSVNPPLEEAHRIYIEQPRLVERIWKSDSGLVREWVIWDVGLGAATNAMAAIRAIEQAASQVQGAAEKMNRIRVISFENDLDSLRLALHHIPRFPQLQHGAPTTVLKEGKWSSKSLPLEWELIEGDFLQKLDQVSPPDLIFYDPFSYKTDSSLWTLGAFRQVFEKCSGRRVDLYTYSASTSVRSALLAAGFFVGRGVGTGPKEETTVAWTAGDTGNQFLRSESLLGQEWLARWERSGSKFPLGLHELEKVSLKNAIRLHPQFNSC